MPEWREEFPIEMVTAIVEKVGILRSFKYISEVEAKPASGDAKAPSLFSSFLNKVVQENIFTKAYVQKIMSEAERKPEWNLSSQPNSYASSTLPQSKLAINRIESEKENQENAHNRKQILSSKLMLNTKQEISKEDFDEKRMSPVSKDDNFGTYKDFYDVSEMAFSVSSDYFDLSDDETQSRKQTELSSRLGKMRSMTGYRLSSDTLRKDLIEDGDRSRENRKRNSVYTIKTDLKDEDKHEDILYVFEGVEEL